MKGWKEKGGSTFGSLARIIQGKKDSSFTNHPSEFATICNNLELHIVEFHSPKAETFFSCTGPVLPPLPFLHLGIGVPPSFEPLHPLQISCQLLFQFALEKDHPGWVQPPPPPPPLIRERDCSRVGRGVNPPPSLSLFAFFRGSCCNLLPSFYSSFFPKLHVVQDP